MNTIKLKQTNIESRLDAIENNNKNYQKKPAPSRDAHELKKKYNLKFNILRDQRKKLLRGIKCQTEDEKSKFYKLFGDDRIAPSTAFEFTEFEKLCKRFTKNQNIILTFNSKQSAKCFETRLITMLKDPTTGPNSIKDLLSKNPKN